VKALAVQTAKATDQITAQIAAVQARPERVEAIRRKHRSAAGDRPQPRSSRDRSSSRMQRPTRSRATSPAPPAANQAVVAVLDEVAGATSKTRALRRDVLSATRAVEAAAGDLREKVEASCANRG